MGVSAMPRLMAVAISGGYNKESFMRLKDKVALVTGARRRRYGRLIQLFITPRKKQC